MNNHLNVQDLLTRSNHPRQSAAITISSFISPDTLKKVFFLLPPNKYKVTFRTTQEGRIFTINIADLDFHLFPPEKKREKNERKNFLEK